MSHVQPLINIPFQVETTPATPQDVQDAVDSIVIPVGGLVGSHQRRVDDNDPTILYLGLANIGALEENADWLIYKVDMNVGYQWQQATGSWTERANLEYA